MYVQYNQLPDSARVWIYQANRPFSIEEIEYISARAINFIDQWTRHGSDLKGSFTIKYNQFLMIAVDEDFNGVSGCSIDASVRFIKELEQKLDIDLLDKLNVTFKEGEHIQLTTLSDFQDLIKEGSIIQDTIVFNNMVQLKKDVETNWEIPLKDSWHRRFLV